MYHRLLMKWLWIVLCVYSLSLSAQTDTVRLTTYAFSQKDAKQKYYIPSFKFKSTTLSEFTSFGVRLKTKPKKFSVIMPDLQNCTDTAYAFVYSGALNEGKGGYYTMIIGNYRRKAFKDAYLVIDRNNNHDLRDDRVDTFYFRESKKTIDVNVSADADYKIVMERFGFFDMIPYKKMLDEYYKAYTADSNYTGADYGFVEKRLHMKKGKVLLGNDSVQIALRDVNDNGKYNDAGDRILLLNNTDTAFDDERFFEIAANETIFEWGGRVYRVNYIDPRGNALVFSPASDKSVSKQLKQGKKIPKFVYHSWDGKTSYKVKKLRRKSLYIYFFNSELPEFVRDSMYLNNIQIEYGDKINVLALSYNEYYRNLQVLMQFDKPTWRLGMVSASVIRQFYVEKLPKGIYCRKRLRLEKENISPKEMYEYLEKLYD